MIFIKFKSWLHTYNQHCETAVLLIFYLHNIQKQFFGGLGHKMASLLHIEIVSKILMNNTFELWLLRHLFLLHLTSLTSGGSDQWWNVVSKFTMNRKPLNLCNKKYIIRNLYDNLSIKQLEKDIEIIIKIAAQIGW